MAPLRTGTRPKKRHHIKHEARLRRLGSLLRVFTKSATKFAFSARGYQRAPTAALGARRLAIATVRMLLPGALADEAELLITLLLSLSSFPSRRASPCLGTCLSLRPLSVTLASSTVARLRLSRLGCIILLAELTPAPRGFSLYAKDGP